MSQHVNSRRITIFRNGSLLSKAQGPEIDDFFSSSKQYIGSYFDSVNSQKVGSGLSFKEEDLLLPRIIDTPTDDRDFRKKVTEFYTDLATSVPHGTGVTLEVGLDTDNTKDVTKDNMPINLMDYLRYRHALKHPFVAESKELAQGNQLKQYYVFDKNNVQAKNSKRVQDLDSAMQLYLTVKSNTESVKQLITLLGIDPRTFVGNDRDNLMVEKLREILEKDPEKFSKVYGQGDLEIRSDIQTMVNVKVLKQIGTRYLDAETEALIGNTLDETIFWFKDDVNSDSIIALKARMQEAMVAIPTVSQRKTVV